MIKKVIFDLDNTLMNWKDEYIFALTNVINKLNLNYNNDKIKEIDKALTIYENYNTLYTKESFLKFLNDRCNINLPIEFVDMLIEEQCNCFEILSKEKIDTLEYLSNKYKLIVISNWFTYTQRKRLENAGIAKYFEIITGGDEHELKPSLNAFCVIENPSECIMVGDSIKNDIEPALKLGMQAVLITDKNVRKDLRYKRIKKLEELKEML